MRAGEAWIDAIDDTEQRAYGKRDSQLEPWLELFPGPCVHADLAAAAALAASDDHCAAALIEVGFRKCERFLDA